MDEAWSAPDLQRLYQDRAIHWAAKHRHQNDMVNIYNGQMPPQVGDLFKEDSPGPVTNWIRSSADDQAAMTAKVFPVYMPAWRDSNPVREAAEKLEKIAYGWNDAGQRCDSLGMLSMMKVWAHFLVLTGESCGLVWPSRDRKTPYFTWRDPRSFFAPEGWSSWQQGKLTNPMFAYRIKLSALKARYEDSADKLDEVYGTTYFFKNPHYGFQGTQSTGWKSATGAGIDDRYVMVAEYFSEDAWIIATVEDKQVVLLETYKGDPGFPGIQPAVAFSLFNPTNPRSPFADQVMLQAAFDRMLGLKLDYYEQTLDAPIFTTPLVGDELETGPGSLNYFDPSYPGNPHVEVLNPRNAIDADQTMSTVASLVKFMNRDSDSRHGSGPADSAKALDKLQEGITTQIQDWYWPPLLENIPRLYGNCARTVINLWPDEELSVKGVRRNHRFVATYKASELEGHEDDYEIEPGLGLGGYSQELAIMQRVAAKMLSRREAMELLPGNTGADESLRLMMRDQLEELALEGLGAQLQANLLAPDAIWKLLQKLGEGKVIVDAVEELRKEGGLMAPPPPEAGMGEIPSEAQPGIEQIAKMAAGMEGGGMPPQSAPLRVLRGGRA